MRSRQFVYSVALAVACLLLSSCGGESKNPLSDPLKAKPDVQLAGVWRLTDPHDPNGVGYIHVGRAGGELPPGIMRGIVVAHNSDGTINLEKQSEVLAIVTTIGKDHYLSGVQPENEEKGLAQLEKAGWNPKVVKSYCLLKYDVQSDTLRIWLMDGDVQKKLIRSGKVKGTIERSGLLDTSGEFTDSTENLAAMLAAPENASLFDKEPTLRFKRVK